RLMAVQNSIPEHETFIARLRKPFLLNFGRNQIYVIDWPYATSLPPGMPREKSKDLAEYFLSKSIRYIAYEASASGVTWLPSGSPECEESYTADKYILLHGGLAAYACAVSVLTLEFQRHLDELTKTRKLVYSEGGIVVI